MANTSVYSLECFIYIFIYFSAVKSLSFSFEIEIHQHTPEFKATVALLRQLIHQNHSNKFGVMLT